MNYHPGFHQVQKKKRLFQSEYNKLYNLLNKVNTLLNNACYSVVKDVHFKQYDEAVLFLATLPTQFMPVSEKIITLQEWYDDMDRLKQYIEYADLRAEDRDLDRYM